MNSSLIGKVEKAKRYAEERDRVRLYKFSAEFRGENNTHQISYKSDKWSCTCDYFAGHGLCSHTMALQRMFEGMIQDKQAVEAQ